MEAEVDWKLTGLVFMLNCNVLTGCRWFTYEFTFFLQIAKTTLSSKIVAQHKEFFSNLAVDAVLRLKGSGNLDAIQIIKKQGGTLRDSFLDEGETISMLPPYMDDI